jgi:phosphoglycerate dehydrogenase-like enzyme
MGVGFDHIDMAAATDAGVLVAITPDAVRRPVASGILALTLALAHRIPERDRAARAGAWHERFARPGTGLEGRTLGVVGLGNIGTELVKLIRPFGMRHLFADPRATPAHAAALDGRLVPLDELIAAADFLVLACPLTEATRGMVDRAWLRRMKASAYLVNMARGELVVQPALVEALSEGWIAGAGIDVFEVEPPDPSDPLLALSNVILSSHNLCFTDELDRLGHQGVVDAITACVDGRLPDHALNPEAWRRSDAS